MSDWVWTNPRLLPPPRWLRILRALWFGVLCLYAVALVWFVVTRLIMFVNLFL